MQENASSTVIQEVLLNGNIPVAGRTGLMSGTNGGLIPPILLDETRVPHFYHEAIVACGASTNTMLPHTALVYNMMVTSGLPRHILSYIWSAVNRTLPGQLTRQEFYSCLALIALAQKGESIAALSNYSQLPIPHLQTTQVPIQPASTTVIGGQQQPTRSKAASSASRFIPTSLLSRFKQEPRKEVDLIGDIVPSSTQAKSTEETMTSFSGPVVETEQTKEQYSEKSSEPNYDLSDVDWSNIGGSFAETSESSDSNKRPISASPQPSQRLPNIEEAVQVATKLFNDCELTLSKSTNDVLSEVFQTEKGVIYLRSLHAVNMVVNRIFKTSSGYLSKEMKDDVDICRKIWTKYEKYLRSVKIESESGFLSTSSSCPICQDIITSSAVEFGTRTYHSTCANLWINCVRPVLP